MVLLRAELSREIIGYLQILHCISITHFLGGNHFTVKPQKVNFNESIIYENRIINITLALRIGTSGLLYTWSAFPVSIVHLTSLGERRRGEVEGGKADMAKQRQQALK